MMNRNITICMFKDGQMECYQFSKLHVVITIIMYLDNHEYKNHDDLIIITKNNHDISIFNDDCPTLDWTADHVIVCCSVVSSTDHTSERVGLAATKRFLGNNDAIVMRKGVW